MCAYVCIDVCVCFYACVIVVYVHEYFDVREYFNVRVYPLVTFIVLLIIFMFVCMYVCMCISLLYKRSSSFPIFGKYINEGMYEYRVRELAEGCVKGGYIRDEY